MEEEKRAFLSKHQDLKQTTTKAADTHKEPRQHTPCTKRDKKKGTLYVAAEDDQKGTTASVREPGWNVWERDAEGKSQQSRNQSSANPTSSYDLSKYCEYHKIKEHDTKECKQLQEALLTAFKKGNANPEPPKKKPKSWSKTKDMKKTPHGKTADEANPGRRPREIASRR